MAICSSLAITLMVAINSIMAILGLSIVGAGGYAMSQMSTVSQFISQEGIIMAMCLGGFIFVLSLLGCCGAIKHNKCLIGVYLIFMFVITGAMIIVSVMVYIYGGQVGTPTETGHTVSNVILKAYASCCDNKLFPAVPCTLGVIAKNVPLYSCYYPKCDGTNAEFCAAIDEDKIPWTSDACSGLKQTAFAGTTNNWDNKCTEGPTIWGKEVETFIMKYLKVGTYAMLGLACTLLVLFLSGVGLCCKKKDEFDNQAAY